MRAVSIASGVAADRSAGATALADRPAATALAGVDPALALAAARVESLGVTLRPQAGAFEHALSEAPFAPPSAPSPRP